MIWIDYIIICIFIFSILVSMTRGFIREALSLVTWIITFFITSHYYSYIAIYFTSVKKQMVRDGIAMALLLIATLLVRTIINYVISSFIARTGLSSTDRGLGVCFGVLRGIFIVSASLFFLDTFTGFSHSQDWQQSQLIPQFSGIIRYFFYYLQSTSSFLSRQSSWVR